MYRIDSDTRPVVWLSRQVVSDSCKPRKIAWVQTLASVPLTGSVILDIFFNLPVPQFPLL